MVSTQEEEQFRWPVPRAVRGCAQASRLRRFLSTTTPRETTRSSDAGVAEVVVVVEVVEALGVEWLAGKCGCADDSLGCRMIDVAVYW